MLAAVFVLPVKWSFITLLVNTSKVSLKSHHPRHNAGCCLCSSRYSLLLQSPPRLFGILFIPFINWQSSRRTDRWRLTLLEIGDCLTTPWMAERSSIPHVLRNSEWKRQWRGWERFETKVDTKQCNLRSVDVVDAVTYAHPRKKNQTNATCWYMWHFSDFLLTTRNRACDPPHTPSAEITLNMFQPVQEEEVASLISSVPPFRSAADLAAYGVLSWTHAMHLQIVQCVTASGSCPTVVQVGVRHTTAQESWSRQQRPEELPTYLQLVGHVKVAGTCHLASTSWKSSPTACYPVRSLPTGNSTPPKLRSQRYYRISWWHLTKATWRHWPYWTCPPCLTQSIIVFCFVASSSHVALMAWRWVG